MKRISEYSDGELKDMTNQEVKVVVEYELTLDPENQEYKQIVSDIEGGTYLNPYKHTSSMRPSKAVGVIALCLWGGVNILTANLLSLGGGTTYNIPIISSITPVLAYMRYGNGEESLEVMSQSEFWNKTRFQRELQNRGVRMPF